MKQFATKEATLAALISIGFIPVPDQDVQDFESDHFFLDSSKNDGFGLPVVQISIYQCSNFYYCVDVDSGWKAPCIWNGPKAEWDKTDTLSEFISFLDKNYPGWK